MEIIPQIIVNSLIASSFYILLGIGFNLMYNVTKFFNLAYGTIAIIGGYITIYLLQTVQIPLWIAVLIGICVTGLVGLVLEKGIFYPLRKKKSSNLVLLIASLGVSTALEAFLAILFSPQLQTFTSSIRAAGLHHVFQVANSSITLIQVMVMIAAVSIFLLVYFLLKKTAYGKAIRAISDDEEVAKIIGINTNHVVGIVFFLSSAIAGLAGILFGLDIGLVPTLGFILVLKAIIVCIIGGMGNIYGGVLGALLLGFIENFGILKISGEWKDAIAFVVLILFLVFRPKGILSK